ncbi:MAG: PadR family transcriptional regulator [Anaeroplasmataceae bacterium]|nr:PadR family transcriptional regulator [Anaeroplasmataceae bacterium]
MSWKTDIEENFKVGLLDLLILKLLSKEDMYGYQLKQELLSQSDNSIEIKEGSLYGPFYRLEKKEFIISKKVLVGAKRFRVYYHLTEKGKEYLDCGIEVFSKIYTGANTILMR